MSAAGAEGTSAAVVVLDRAGIEALLPHRAPFLLLDDVVELEPGVRCVARRLLRPDEFWFAGHFPGNPVMPGVLIVEALAQAGAVCALALPENAGKLVLFAGIDKVRFKRVVRPGDTLRLEVQVGAMRAGVGRGAVLATVEGQVACRGELMFALTDAAQAADGQPVLSRRGWRRRRMTRGVIRGARIASVGVSLPERVLTNEEISRTLDTSDEWIRTRTGIRERRIAAAGQAPSDLAAEAGARALDRAGVSARDLDLVISSSLVPDMVFPATAAVVADRLGASAAGAFDVQAGCSGFVFALASAASFVGSGMYARILVTGAEVVSRALDWHDRSTCILFGDGAGAAVVTGDPEAIFTFDLGTDGAGMPFLNMPAGGARLPASPRDGRGTTALPQDERAAKCFALPPAPSPTRALNVLSAAGIGVADVDLFVPHQANLRIIDHVAQRIGIAPERVFTNLRALRQHELRVHPALPRRSGGDRAAQGGRPC